MVRLDKKMLATSVVGGSPQWADSSKTILGKSLLEAIE
jgi:hypothetical protein